MTSSGSQSGHEIQDTEEIYGADNASPRQDTGEVIGADEREPGSDNTATRLGTAALISKKRDK